MVKLQHYDIAIIGSGPAGLMNAYKNVHKNLKVLMIEAGRNRSANYCNIKDLKGLCSGCNPCSNISGFGGCAGPNHSMKLSFPPSGKRLTELLGAKTCDNLAKSFWNFYSRFADISLPFPKMNNNNEYIMKLLNKTGADFFNYPIHLFTENEHNTFLKNIFSFLNNRCKILLNTNIDLNKDINLADKTININGNKASFSKLIIATGRKGLKGTNIFAENLGIERVPENVNIGFRVLMPSKYMDKLSQIHPDYKIKQNNIDSKLETFCFCNQKNGGRLEFVRYDDFLNIDGQMSINTSGHNINNTVYGNFAVLFENKANPVRFEDFVNRIKGTGGRFEYNIQNWHKFNENGFFKENEAKALSEFLDNFLDIVARENNIDKSVLYNEIRIAGPEAENIWARNKKLWVKDDIAMVGDCSGLAQGIVSSGMMGEQVSKIRL